MLKYVVNEEYYIDLSSFKNIAINDYPFSITFNNDEEKVMAIVQCNKNDKLVPYTEIEFINKDNFNTIAESISRTILSEENIKFNEYISKMIDNLRISYALESFIRLDEGTTYTAKIGYICVDDYKIGIFENGTFAITITSKPDCEKVISISHDTSITTRVPLKTDMDASFQFMIGDKVYSLSGTILAESTIYTTDDITITSPRITEINKNDDFSSLSPEDMYDRTKTKTRSKEDVLSSIDCDLDF